MSKKNYEPKVGVYKLSEKIEKTYGKFKVNIEIVDWDIRPDRICYEVKVKGTSREADVFSYASEVQSRLKLPLFHVEKKGFIICITTSDKNTKCPHLLKILGDPAYEEDLDEAELPYVIGYDSLGQPVVVDLSEFPHLLLGGSTNSGKSVGLQALITSNINTKPPSEVNFVLIDVGAGDLMVFDGIPHLSCPVVQDRDAAYYVITALKVEMERRINLGHANANEFERLSRVVVVVDEFPALCTGADKAMTKTLTNDISSLLQRGRHAKIHLVLAAQNPTFNLMKVDLGNITSRIAFRCAKKNFSETILGEGGAEKLSGPGSLLLKLPLSNGLQYIQGIYIKPEDIQRVVQWLKSPQYQYGKADGKFNITVPPEALTEAAGERYSRLRPIVAAAGPSEQELLFAAVLFWTFGKNHISTNMLMVEHHLGWNKATNLVKQMELLGVVSKLNGKQPRTVRPKRIDDLPAELVEFMECCDYPCDSLICAFQERVAVKRNYHNHNYSGGKQDE